MFRKLVEKLISFLNSGEASGKPSNDKNSLITKQQNHCLFPFPDPLFSSSWAYFILIWLELFMNYRSISVLSSTLLFVCRTMKQSCRRKLGRHWCNTLENESNNFIISSVAKENFSYGLQKTDGPNFVEETKREEFSHIIPILLNIEP